MSDLPSGFADMLGDAELAPPAAPLAELEVRGVGPVSARRPMPAAAALLAMSAKSAEPKADEPAEEFEQRELLEQQGYVSRFIGEHLAGGEYERVLMAMMDGELPSDTLTRITSAIATWGTARPFGAVLSLSLMAATHWRAVRTRIRSYGIADPMRLPSMHDVLDEAEKIWLEQLHTGDEAKDKMVRGQLFDKLYAPDPDDTEVSGGGKRPPSWFDPTQVEATFNAMTRTLGDAL